MVRSPSSVLRAAQAPGGAGRKVIAGGNFMEKLLQRWEPHQSGERPAALQAHGQGAERSSPRAPALCTELLLQ